jgi:hypothetical protein
VSLDPKVLSTITKLAGSPVADFVAGAAANPRLGSVQFGGDLSGKLASAGYSNLDIAKTAGALKALAEDGFTLKQASEMLQQPEAALEMIVKVTGI